MVDSQMEHFLSVLVITERGPSEHHWEQELHKIGFTDVILFSLNFWNFHSSGGMGMSKLTEMAKALGWKDILLK